MTEILFMIYLSGALIWAIAHTVLAVDSAADARLWREYRPDASRYAEEAIGYFKALALAPVWPVALLLSARSLLREMQEIAGKDGA